MLYARTRILPIAAVSLLAVGCLTRPIISNNPTDKAVVIDELSQTSIDKVDLLFAIDNSASMGDKQDLLAAAVPVLVNRLLNPNCVDVSATCKVASDCTTALGATAQCDTAANNGAGACFVAGDNQGGAQQCSTIPSTKPEFPPVHDLHVGVVSSSMGGGGAETCAPADSSDSTHQDDHGWLLNRTTSNTPIANANATSPPGGDFLAWLPPSDPKNAGKAPPNVTPYATSMELVSDFQSLVSGVQQHGCGLEAQLESWYHFLVQPDPWQSITLGSDNRAAYQGVDSTLLKMRHDFLRPDSLVAIIQLTDEEDSWSDPMWDGGFGWVARTDKFPGGPDQAGTGPRGTHECDTNPNDPDCTSCAFADGKTKKPVSGELIDVDPNCTSCAGGTNNCPKPGWYTSAQSKPPIAAADGLNVRYGEQLMKRRYGFDNQHNIQRYIDGLQSTAVPDRDNESHDHDNYAPNKNCLNPLYAPELPDGSDTSPATLCPPPPSSKNPVKTNRPTTNVFYALIGGVPNDLVTGDPQWSKILGADPSNGDTTGIDPRMIESITPRAGVQGEWNTLSSSAYIDYEYACTFDLPKQRTCTSGDSSCDCQGVADGPPLCSSPGSTTQVKGKAYPTIRELRVAKGLGDQAVVASLCAPVVSGSTSDPAYGYNPAMQAIVNRLKKQLAQQCLPQKLVRDTAGEVPCLVLAEYTTQTDQSAGCTDPGMCNPADPTTCGCQATDANCIATYKNILSRYQSQFQASLGDGGASTPTPTPVACIFQQIADPTCASAQNAGWCYVEGTDATGGCPQAIQFGGSGPPSNVTISLECIE